MTQKTRPIRTYALYSKTRKCIIRDEDECYAIYPQKHRAEYHSKVIPSLKVVLVEIKFNDTKD